MGWLKGNVTIITGGGSGLGRALVERFIAEGASVGVLERSTQKAESLLSEWKEQVQVVIGDVGNYADNEEIVRATVNRFGKLDTFISNAGVWDFAKSLVEMEVETLSPAFDELFSVNVKGALLGAKAALPHLVETRGCLIATISNAGFYTGGGGPIYTASKHALVGLVRQLAYELAPKIRVNGVAPGGMATELGGLIATNSATRKLNQIGNFNERLIGKTPLRVAPTPKDYCGPYVLLASRENSGPMTGVVINTDGGQGIRGIGAVNGGENLGQI